MTANRALKAVREQRGLKIEAVADVAAISLKRLETFEQGDLQPSRKQVERLSDIYGVPLYSLLGSGIPNLPPLPQDFRKPNPAPAELSPKGMRVLWATEKRAQFTKQLIAPAKFTAPNLLGSPTTSAASITHATQLRETFDAWLMPRLAKFGFLGTSEQQFLSGLRLFFEVQGNVVNSNDAPPDDYFGFFVEPAAGTPAIFINRCIQSKRSQLFTLAHELAHWLVGADGISNPFILRNNVERTCNKFAAEFLAPIARFTSLAESVPGAVRSDIFQFVSTVSSRSLLSKHATAIRLTESGYLTQGQLAAWESRWTKTFISEKEADPEASGGHAHAKRMSEVGVLPVYLAAVAHREKLIDKYDVSAGIGLAESLQQKAFALAERRIEVAAK